MRRVKTRKQKGGFTPPPLMMAKFIQNVGTLLPAAILSGVRFMQNAKTKKSKKRRVR
jgi:hypothetical protein